MARNLTLDHVISSAHKALLLEHAKPRSFGAALLDNKNRQRTQRLVVDVMKELRQARYAPVIVSDPETILPPC